jgi:hypothetical protein
VDFYSDAAEEVEYSEIISVRGQLGPLREFSRLRKLKTPIVTLLGWSPGELPLHIAEAGLDLACKTVGKSPQEVGRYAVMHQRCYYP